MDEQRSAARFGTGRAAGEHHAGNLGRGDAVDKAYVLRFLWFHRERRADWVLEGAKSEDCGLAYLALFEAETMLRDGFDLGPDILRVGRSAQQKCGEPFWVLVNGIRMALEDRDELTTPGGSIQTPRSSASSASLR